MKRFASVSEYLSFHESYSDILNMLREILLECGLDETVKWGAPCYTLEKKNVVGIAAFKSYVGLWFHQGSLLKDESKVLYNAQEGVTKALRQWRFETIEDIDPEMIKKYVLEALENEKKGLRLAISKQKPLLIPDELRQKLEENISLKKSFEQFTSFKQKEFCEYISSAKRESTRLNRLKKIIPLIESNTGLNDRYRK